MTTYETALNEFRDASAAVRRAFGAVAEARELQIIADSQHRHASNAHADAVSRLERADAALTQARAAPTGSQAQADPYHNALLPREPRAGEVYDATGETPAMPRVTQADIDAIGAPLTNGSIDAQEAGLGIG